jgi:hypothetical protein
MLGRSRVAERSRAPERQRGVTIASLILTTRYTRSPTANMGDEFVTNSPLTNPNVTPSLPSLDADHMSTITSQSAETDTNVTLENVTLIDGVPTRDGILVLDEAPSNTDTDHAPEPAEPVHETVLVSFRLPRPSVIEALRDRGFLGDADNDEDITRAVLGMLAAAWKAGIRAEAPTELKRSE